MTLTPQQMDRAIDAHFHYEATDDIDGVVGTLTPDVIHDIVGAPGGPTHGPDNARPFYQQLFADLADGSVTCTKRLYGENFLVDESTWKGRATGRPFGIEGRDRSLEFRLLHVIEFAGDARIRSENVWIDLAAIMQQLPPD